MQLIRAVLGIVTIGVGVLFLLTAILILFAGQYTTSAVSAFIGLTFLVIGWKWLRRRQETGRHGSAHISGPGTYSIEVVGESHYQTALERLCGGRSKDGANVIAVASLVPEDNNPHDEKAVRIDIDGQTVGYLTRPNARVYRKRLKQAGHSGIVATCSAKIVGGWDRGKQDRGHFGVCLDMPTAEE